MPSDVPRSGAFVAWGSAWLAGEAGLEETVTRIRARDEAGTVTGPGTGDLDVHRSLPRLRADGVTRLRLVLPAPGDPSGLPGPGPFSSAAMSAREAVLCLRDDATAVGLVPTVTVHGTSLDGTATTTRWSGFPLPHVGPWPGPFLPEAEQDLRRGVLEAAAGLRELSAARWGPELADALQELRTQARRGVSVEELPAAFPPRAREVLARCRQLDAVLALAAQQAGGALDTRQTLAREALLRDLARLVRRARVAAYNALADTRP